MHALAYRRLHAYRPIRLEDSARWARRSPRRHAQPTGGKGLAATARSPLASRSRSRSESCTCCFVFDYCFFCVRSSVLKANRRATHTLAAVAPPRSPRCSTARRREHPLTQEVRLDRVAVRRPAMRRCLEMLACASLLAATTAHADGFNDGVTPGALPELRAGRAGRGDAGPAVRACPGGATARGRLNRIISPASTPHRAVPALRPARQML